MQGLVRPGDRAGQGFQTSKVLYTNLGKGGLFWTEKSRRSEVRGRTSPHI